MTEMRRNLRERKWLSSISEEESGTNDRLSFIRMYFQYPMALPPSFRFLIPGAVQTDAERYFQDIRVGIIHRANHLDWP